MLNIKKIKKFDNLSFSTKKFLQFYNWKNCNPSKYISLNKKLQDCKVAIISSAGLIIKNKQKPFDSNIKMGDTSFRIIPSNINANNLEEHHRSNSFDHFGIKTNPFSALTIPHLLDLSNEGIRNFQGPRLFS